MGIHARDAGVSISNATFDNVYKPFDIRTSDEVNIEGTRINQDPNALVEGAASSRTQVGWTGRKGPRVQAQCPRCGSIFPSRNYDVSSPRFWNRDNEETCQNPRCRYPHAKVADGLYDTSLEIVRELSRETTTRANLREINAESLAFLRGETTPQSYIENVSKTNSKIGSLLRNGFKIALTSLTALASVAAIGSYKLDLEMAEIQRRQDQFTMQQAQQNPNQKSEKLLEDILKGLEQSRFESEFVKKSKVHRDKNADGNPQEVGGDKKATVKNKAERKPKARDIRRKEAKKRRQALNPVPR